MYLNFQLDYVNEELPGFYSSLELADLQDVLVLHWYQEVYCHVGESQVAEQFEGFVGKYSFSRK